MCWMLLPLMVGDLGLPLDELVLATDASSTGHGLAYTHWREEVSREWSRQAEFRGSYTALWQSGDVHPRADGPRNAAEVPTSDYKWLTVGKPGGESHITIEEARAAIWGCEHKIRRASALETRTILLIDNAPVVCAFAKGRSASRLLNREVRRFAVLCLAGNCVFLPIWIASRFNPADAPSRNLPVAFSTKVALAHSLPADRVKPNVKINVSKQIPVKEHSSSTLSTFNDSTVKTAIPARLTDFASDASFVIHLFSGQRRSGDFEEQFRGLMGFYNLTMVVLSFDLLLGHDILDVVFWSFLVRLCKTGRVKALFAGPPCSTWSRLRHLLGGPPPLRSRRLPWDYPR